MINSQNKNILVKSKEDYFESYTGMMSHEFTTPLETALMFIDFLEIAPQSETAKSYLHAMKSSLAMLLYLVNDILDMKAIKEGTFSSHINIFNLQNVFNRLLSITELQAQSRRLSIRLKFVDSVDHIGKFNS